MQFAANIPFEKSNEFASQDVRELESISYLWVLSGWVCTSSKILIAKMVGDIKKNISISCVGFYLNGSLGFWCVVLYILDTYLFFFRISLFSQALACLLFSFNNAVLSPINVLLRRDTVGILYRCLVFDCCSTHGYKSANVRGLSVRRNRCKVLYIHPRILQKV